MKLNRSWLRKPAKVNFGMLLEYVIIAMCNVGIEWGEYNWLASEIINVVSL